MRPRFFVTAVIVSHEGAIWLPAVLTQLARQSRPTDAVVAVDTGSQDLSAALLTESLGTERVLVTDASVDYSQAVALAVDSAPHSSDEEWLWLLHDDSAPDEHCLAALLACAEAHPSAGVIGPKILGWHDRRLLLEAGVSVTGSGRRYTGLERREHDQGQHDGVRDVLSVSSAGMLIRRDVWDRLRGFDPNLPLFRNDLDLCWRAQRSGVRVLVATDAVLHHREASAHGRRAIELRAAPADRAAAVHVLLVQASGWQRPFIAVRLFLGGVMRTLAALLGKDFTAARDEISGTLAGFRHPGRIAASVRRAQETTDEPASAVRFLRPSAATQVRQVLEAAAGVLTTSSAPASTVSALDSGPVDDEAAFMEESGSWVRRILWRPSVLLVLALTVFAIVATRGLWWGSGVLQGGALLPALPGASDLLAFYTRAWHDVGPGSDVPAPPYVLAIFAIAFLLLGKAPLAVSVLLLLAIPIAGWAAYITLRGVIAYQPLRIWAAVTYALLPAIGGAIASGRIATSIAAIALPFAVRSMVRISSPQGTVRRAAGTALLVAVVIAAVPGLWFLFAIPATVIAVRGALLRTAGWTLIGRRLLLAVVTPIVVLLPWSWYVITNPALLLLQPGVSSAGLTDPELGPLNVALLHPGGPGMTPLWATAGLVLAGVLALLRSDRIRLIGMAWFIGLLALALGVGQSVLLVTPPSGASPIRAWPGPATLVLGAAMIVATAIALDGLRARIAGASFTWIQPVAGLMLVGAITAPALSAVLWLPLGEGVLRKGPVSAVPAFVAAEAESPQAPRTLILRQDRTGRVSYSLLNGSGPVLGESDVSPPAEVWAALDPAVAALAAGLGGDEVDILAGYGVRFVLLAAGTSSDLIPVIDAEPGLRRLSTAQGEILWRISGVTARARVIAPDQAALPVGLFDPLTMSTNPYIDQPLPDSAGERTLVLGATPTSGWRATAGAALSPTNPREPYQWSAGFTVPAGPETVTVTFDGQPRNTWLIVQAVIFALLVILALPSRTRDDGDIDVDLDDEVEVAP